MKNIKNKKKPLMKNIKNKKKPLITNIKNKKKTLMTNIKNPSKCNMNNNKRVVCEESFNSRGRRGRDCMVVGFTTICAISACHQ